MKATGIVRRIDELGRVVIPKERRRTLRIREGDALEIYTDRDGGVILRKYSMIGELAAFAAEYCDTLRQSVGHTALICDKDAVVACRSVSRRDQAPPSPIAPADQRRAGGRDLRPQDGQFKRRKRRCASAADARGREKRLYGRADRADHRIGRRRRRGHTAFEGAGDRFRSDGGQGGGDRRGVPRQADGELISRGRLYRRNSPRSSSLEGELSSKAA